MRRHDADESTPVAPAVDSHAGPVTGLYIGAVRALQGSGAPSAIYKHSVDSVRVGELGIDGDYQADKRYHGGPDKALHQYAVSSYRKIVARYPALVDSAVPGAIGENITCGEMRESTVCIGDIYRVGDVSLQLSEPRKPCWKINARFEVEKLSVFIEENGITGWYFRVLRGGVLRLGDRMELVDRINPRVTVEQFNRVIRQHRPDGDQLDELIRCRGLADSLRGSLQQRRNYLQAKTPN